MNGFLAEGNVKSTFEFSLGFKRQSPTSFRSLLTNPVSMQMDGPVAQ
jgi:hypothetical protein